MSFETFEFDPAIMAAVRQLGYTEPTPIQIQAIPPIMQGRDVVGLAQTGTGKTAAFALPISHRLLNGPRRIVRAAIISPTRELAEQTNETFCELGKQTGLQSVAIYGGVSMEYQLRRLREGVEVVVACPGRLLDHLWKGSVDLSHLEVLVIDEADRMFDMGFQPAIRSILQCIMQRRQTLLFSATMPEEIRRLTQDILHDPVTVQIGRTAPAATVSHALYPVKPHLKTPLLMALLSKTDTESVLVFTRTKHRCEQVALRLQRAGLRATSIQGDLSQPRRQAALDGFRSGQYKILVATDIAARGIDISTISHVINYDMPDEVDAYIHRIGRTGRIGNTGEAWTLVTGEDTTMIRDLERVLKAKLETRTLEGFDYNQPASEGDRSGLRRQTRGAAPANRRPMGSRDPYRAPSPRLRAGFASR